MLKLDLQFFGGRGASGGGSGGGGSSALGRKGSPKSADEAVHGANEHNYNKDGAFAL